MVFGTNETLSGNGVFYGDNAPTDKISFGTV
jgi:hypothetical protein